MKWIQIGTSKSGNYWIYNILQKVAERAGLERKSFIQSQPIHAIAKNWKMGFPNQQDIDHISITPTALCYRIGNIFVMPIDNFDDYISHCSHVWLHSPYCARTGEILPKFEKIIYLIRDPRDILISLSHFAFTPYRLKHFPSREKTPETYIQNNLEEIILSWLNHVCGYLKHGKQFGIYFAFYERLLFDFETELRQIVNYLAVPLTDQAIREIRDEVAFKTMKTQSTDHLRKGEYGQWIDGLTNAQVNGVSRLAGQLLRLFGYAATKGQQLSYPLPQLPKEISARVIDKIVGCGNRLGKIYKTKRLVSKIKTNLKSWVGV